MFLMPDSLLLIAQAAPAPGQGSAMPSLIFFGLMFAAMYFLLIAPQRKKQKEHEKMLAALQSGDEIVTTGGVYGQITNVKDDRFVVRIAENTKVEIGKGFVHGVVRKAGADKA
ncbi:MAG: preprotein translocase subunit YajC [Opitutaceae bacterium]|nr:preprotein translocase subunit YajC [Opitutaceae bacterium]